MRTDRLGLEPSSARASCRSSPRHNPIAVDIGVGRYGSGSKPKSPEVIMLREVKLTSGDESGGGGNRTRVRGRTGQNVYKRSPRFSFDRRPEADALPTV